MVKSDVGQIPAIFWGSRNYESLSRGYGVVWENRVRRVWDWMLKVLGFRDTTSRIENQMEQNIEKQIETRGI